MDTRTSTFPATKLVCTLGPASRDRVRALVDAGMSIARLNLSHGDLAAHVELIEEVRVAAMEAGRPIAILADLPGPKVRLGPLASPSLELETGTGFSLHAGDGSPGDLRGASTSHPGLADDVRIGDPILLAAVELRVTATSSGVVTTVVERGGLIRSGAGLSVPSERLSLPALDARDRALAAFAVQAGVDFVGQSFVRSVADVHELRGLLGDGGPSIVAKIETRPGAEAASRILEIADALMVARGDLGVELRYEEVPLVQLRLIAAARRAGRPVIVATQMLESMTDAPRPTRAEVSDVANAVLDGADAVMLSGETAIGRYPVLAAEAAMRIVRAAELAASGDVANRRPATAGPGGGEARDRDAGAVAVAAAALADADADVDALVTFTRTGRTARLLAALRPRVPVFAVTPDGTVARRLALHRGVVSMTGGDEPAPALDEAVAALREAGQVGPGRAAVLVISSAGGGTGPNVVEVRRVP
jgi:pyruvate kinase